MPEAALHPPCIRIRRGSVQASLPATDCRAVDHTSTPCRSEGPFLGFLDGSVCAVSHTRIGRRRADTGRFPTGKACSARHQAPSTLRPRDAALHTLRLPCRKRSGLNSECFGQQWFPTCPRFAQRAPDVRQALRPTQLTASFRRSPNFRLSPSFRHLPWAAGGHIPSSPPHSIRTPALPIRPDPGSKCGRDDSESDCAPAGARRPR
jgi:hypothetical protein